MNGTCIKCGRPTDTDIDSYSMLHDHCMVAANNEARERNDAIEAGFTGLGHMTAKERERVLAVRQEQRDAIVQD